MKIESITVSNFRCFGAAPTTVDIDDGLTILVGSNGSGKTALLLAMTRLFGTGQNSQLRPDDFHVPDGERLDDHLERTLCVEARISFSGLDGSSEEEDPGVPEFIRLASIDREGGDPFCRIRLEGTWRRDPIPEGDIVQRIVAITSNGDEVAEDNKSTIRQAVRSQIQVVYVPAERDPLKQLKYAAGTHLYRLISSLSWNDETRSGIQEKGNEIDDVLRKNPGIGKVEELLRVSWKKLHDDTRHSNIRLRFAESDLANVLKSVQALFSPSETGGEHDPSFLSDGQKALFYFSLLSVIEDVLQLVSLQRNNASGESIPFEADRLKAPALTIYAVEEPETHVSPHYLGRIIRVLKDLSKHGSTQVIASSHCPSIIKRIDARTIRHFRVDKVTGSTVVSSLTFPDEIDAEYKYVKEAVEAYPEIYFCRCAILVEGDSEELILPKIWNAIEGEDSLDFSLVAVVPLSGRFVHHFWKLLEDLHIPYATLLDLDREREGGGWGRVQYAVKQLIENGRSNQAATLLVAGDNLDSLDNKPVTEIEQMGKYISGLEQYGVFYSQPLDIDLMMLESFQRAYEALDAKPRLTPDKAREHVLGKKTIAATYTEDQKKLFPLYKTLFLGRGKPSTHIKALSEICSNCLKKDAPDVLKRLITFVKKLLPQEVPDGTDKS